ncbi:hypothetical protein HKD42_06915 [Altererythrobacter sp. RZ02]|uniref:Uncharacterized protein n=1 Tax=Pontixanthobacter rizhaonensis TaxID=2730337 RepID=A0A848QQI9_9SPHN|nr:hypothetical protein [Pontixanthobacter rizhaonensis]NMW31786.1 hypothetical protein [Pontixanthobacter rizhaonensis]
MSLFESSSDRLVEKSQIRFGIYGIIPYLKNMEFRLIPALIVFLGSYLPLSIILLAQNFEYDSIGSSLCNPLNSSACSIPFVSPAATIAFAIICAFCMIFTLFVLATTKPKHTIQITKFEYIPTDLMNYTLPYVVSFMNVDFSDIGNFFGFIVFLGWMFWITLRSGQILLNPVLIAAGWRHYTLEYNFSGSHELQTATCLSKVHLQTGTAKQMQVQSILLISQEVS